MIFEYLVSVKNERGKHIDSISQLLCLISVIFFIVQQVKLGNRFYLYLVSSLVIVAGLAWNYYISNKNQQVVYYRRILLLAGVSWIYMPFLQWLAVPLIILALLEKHAKSPLEIGLTNDRVVFNTLIKKEYSWKSFNNVMLKDGMLTLDFKNNRIFQKETIEDSSAEEETEFNEYCRKHLLNQVAGPSGTLS